MTELFTHPRVLCGSCTHRKATTVVYLLEQERDGSAQPWLLPRCDLLKCRIDVPDGVISDAVPLTRELAETITGFDLSTAERIDQLFPNTRKETA